MIKDVYNFVTGMVNYAKFNDMLINPLAAHLVEQAFYRAYLCSDCFSGGRCKHCGCKTPEMFFSPKKEDSEGKWGKMLSKNEWEKEKAEKGIDLKKLTIELEEKMGSESSTNFFDKWAEQFKKAQDEAKG